MPPSFILPGGFSFAARVFTSFAVSLAFPIIARLYFCQNVFFFCVGFLLPPRFSCPLLGARLSFSSLGYKFCQEVFHSAMRLSFFARRLFLLSECFCFFVSFPDYGSCLYTKTIKAKILWGCVVLRFKVLQITCKIPLG